MRYLPLTPTDRQTMLARIGVASIDDLFAAVPADKLMSELPRVAEPAGEMEVEAQLGRLAARNITAAELPFFVGCGVYKHHVPATVDHLIQRSEFMTSYTPYQPEISQGTLHYLFEFQTQVALLTGMEVANASMYDGSTATAEAVLMAHRITRRRKAVISGRLHPHYRAIIDTLSHYGDAEVDALALDPAGEEHLASRIDAQTSCVVVQYPDLFGAVHDLTALAEAAQAHGALLVVAVPEIVALGLVRSPGEMGADIVAAEGQSIGNGLNFGGPHVGLFATRDKYVRQMPGRLAGATVDAMGRRGFVLTLSTREQHIRREKATSNICTNSGLCALAFSVHLTLLGELGLRRLAEINHANACDLADRLAAVDGVEILTPAFFNEFALRLPVDAGQVIDRLVAKRVLGGVPLSRLLPQRPELANIMITASTEINTDQDRATYAEALKEVLS